MKPLSFWRHRFPAAVITHAVRLYFRFTLRFRDVENLLAELGIAGSYEMVCKVAGKRKYLWRPGDDEVLDLVMQRKRHTQAALRLLRRLIRNQPVDPTAIVTDGLTSDGAALRELGPQHLHRPGRLRRNNRAENRHLPIRRHERQQRAFKSKGSAQRSPVTTHGGNQDVQPLIVVHDKDR